MGRRFRWIMLGCVPGLFACSVDTQSREQSSRSWQLSSEPLLSIGAATPLHRMTGAVRLSGGQIAVADGGLGSSRISLFSPQGEFIGVVGRTGEGPGEYQTVTSLQLGPEDSLIAFDRSLQRLTVFKLDQDEPRIEAYRPRPEVAEGGPLGAILRISNETWVGREAETPIWGPPGTISRDTMSVGLMDASLDTFEALEHVPGIMSTVFLREGRRVLTLPAFSPNVLSSTWGRCVFLSAADTSLVSVYSEAGDLIGQFHGPGEPRPVQEEHLDSLLAAQLRRTPENQWPRVRQRLEDAEHTSYLPYYRRMILDEWGHIWLQEYQPPQGLGSRWFVLSQSGELLDTMITLKPLGVFSITEDGVLAGLRGPLDEEYLELYPFLARPEDVARPLASCRNPG